VLARVFVAMYASRTLKNEGDVAASLFFPDAGAPDKVRPFFLLVFFCCRFRGESRITLSF